MAMEKESNAGAAVTAEAQSGIDYTVRRSACGFFSSLSCSSSGYVPAILGLPVAVSGRIPFGPRRKRTSFSAP